jgi:hypothetical protein
VIHPSKREQFFWDFLEEEARIFENILEEGFPSHHTMVGDGEKYKDFDFPIRETKMKNIKPSSLPHFHGLTIEDPNILLFDFEVIYRTCYQPI